MAVLPGATASGRQLYSNALPTTQGTIYTAPSNNANVTSPSATAYIKEIIVCNTTGSPINVSIAIGAYYILDAVTVNGTDTKIISGLNTMIPAGVNVAAMASASGLHCTISGLEVQ